MKKDFNPIWIYILVQFVLGFIIGLIYGIMGLKMDDNISIISTIVSGIATFIIFAIIYRKKIVEDFKRLTKKDILLITIMSIVLVGGNFLLSMIFGEDNDNQKAVIEMINQYKVLSVFVVGVLVPMVEEFVFRYSLDTLFKNKWVFLAVSSILFGLAHVIGVQAIIYIYIGVILALTYIKTNKNIISSTCVHAANNLVSVIMVLLGL